MEYVNFHANPLPTSIVDYLGVTLSTLLAAGTKEGYPKLEKAYFMTGRRDHNVHSLSCTM